MTLVPLINAAMPIPHHAVAAVLADNANWAANNPTRAGCTSDAYKRLKAVSFSSEMIDQIGGWSSGKVREDYRDGFEVGQLHAHLRDII